MTEASIFIVALIIGATQALRYFSPKITGIVTMVVAVVVGIAVALLDTHIGLNDLTVAQGILAALAAIGTHATLTRDQPPKQ